MIGWVLQIEPTKDRGNLIDGEFVLNTSAVDQAKAIKISTGDEAVLFYSNSERAHTAIKDCCNFDNAANQNPATSSISSTGDGSYTLFVRFNDLANNESDELELYYAAGTLADINTIIEEVANAAAAVTDILCESASYDYSFGQTGTTSYIIVPSSATAPTEAQIEAGVNYSGVTLVDNGSASTTANVNHTFSFSGLSENTEYTVYSVTKYNDGSSDVFGPVSNATFTTNDKPDTPTGDANQEFIVTNLNDATVASLVSTPAGTEWYTSTSDADTRTNKLATTDVLTNGNTYYGIQYTDPCSSNIFQVVVDISTFSDNVLAQIGLEGDNPDVTNAVVTVAEINTITPAIVGADPSKESLYQDYIDANPDLFSSPATIAEVQAMIDGVNTSERVLAQIGLEGDNPDVTNAVVTVAEINTITPAIVGADNSKESLYQDYIDANPDVFSSPATIAEVQAMIDSVNTSESVLVQIGLEGDNPDVTNAVVTVAEINTITPAIVGADPSKESLYQDYIDANPDVFSSPATIAEVQAMIDSVNTSESVLAQIGLEGDNPDVTNAVVTVAEINTITPAIVGADPSKESLYQDYIDANPDVFSSPATIAEVQAMIDSVNTSESVLAQIGLEGDNPDVTNAVVTVAEINTITPAIVGADPSKESLYQDYIDANPDVFSSPATIAEVQAMIDSVNTSESVLAQIGLEGDNPDVTNAVVTVAEINTITPAIVGADPSKETLYQDYIDANPDLFSSPATIAEVQAMIDSVNTSESVLAQIGLEGDNPDVTNAVVTVAEINTITPAIVGADPSKESLYQDYIDANPDLFSSPATIAEVQAMIDSVNTSESVLAQIGLEGDNPDVTNAVVTVAEINTITPAIVGADPSKESLYQDYIDANPDVFSSPATIAEVQAMIDGVNTSERVLAQIGLEGDNPDVTNAVVTVAEINTITPAIVGADPSKETLYQDYIDANPDLFSSPATIAEVQAMIDSVNTSESVLAQIGLEGDNPDVTNAVVTVAEINTITPAIVGADPSKESLYQDYIDANPDLFSSPATIAEVQAMIGGVNISESVLAQIGLEGDNPDVTNAVVTVAEINTITPAIVGADPSKESLYQDYIDANPDLFSSPATIAEVQAMIDSVNTSESVLAQIGLEGDNPDVTNAVVTVAEINTITPAIVGADPSKESLYQDYIDANPDLFSSPATIAEVQAMIDSVNTSESVLAQIGLEGDNPDVTNAVVTVAEINTITPAIVGADPSKESLYQDYIDANPDLFSSPATIAEVQAMIDGVNTSESVLAQIGLEGDNPDVTNAVVTVAEINTITPAIVGADNSKESLYQDYIDANPDVFSSPATIAEVQAMIDSVNTSESVLAQIGLEGDNPDVTNAVVTVAEINTITPAIVGADPSKESLYQDYIDANPDVFSSPATIAEVQAMIDSVNTSESVLAQIGLEGDNPDVTNAVVTVAEINTITPAIVGADPSKESLYQDYIDANPDLFSSPATIAEVQAMIDGVNTSESVLAQIGLEGDNPDVTNAVVTVAEINTITPAIVGADPSKESLYQDYIDANPDLFSSPATITEVQAMIDSVNTSESVLAQIGLEGDNPDVTNAVVTVAEINTITPAIVGADLSKESLYQDYIDANPDLFSSPATIAEVQAMIDSVNTSESVLAQIGLEGDNPDVTNAVVTVAEINTITPAIVGADPSKESLYQDYIDANPDVFSSPATIAEVQAMIDGVNTSESVLAQIGLEGDNPDVTNAVVTVAEINTITPAIVGADPSKESLYQDYIDANPDVFSSPATIAEVQAMIDSVNTSESVLAQIGLEGDNPDVTNAVVTVAEINTITPAIVGADPSKESLYQAYIDANPDVFSSPATIAEVQAMIDSVNTSESVLAQIGLEGDNPDVTNAVVTVAEINTITPAIVGADPSKESLYQDYIDANPDLFSSPATIAEVQAMIDGVNTSESVLAQIGLEGDNPDVTNAVVTVAEINTITPAIVGADPSKESLYQDYIDANPDLFSSPATIAEVQAMIDSVNTSESVLAQIGLEGDNPDVTNAVVTVAEINTITPAIVGADNSKESLYQDYIDANPDLFSSPATIAEVQAMIDSVNTSESVLAQIGLEGDNPDVTNAVVTVAEINTITPAIVGADPSKESLYQDYIDANPDVFSSPATIAEVQAMIDGVNTSESVLAQIGLEGDNPDVTNAVVTVAEINTITPAIVGADPSKESLYQDYIDANPDVFSSPATIAEVQAMIDGVNTSESVLAQIGLEGDNPDVTNAVVTVAEINTITPAIVGADPSKESLYQAYIDANPDLFSSPATIAEVQAMIDGVNTSESVLAQIGLEGDNPDVTNAVVTVAEINTITPAIVGADPSKESLYQDYIDANPDLFSSPATIAEVQAMIDSVNTSESVLAQIGLEGDNPDVTNAVVTVAEINTITPAIVGADPSKESLYQDYIDANPDLFSSPATIAEVQAMIDSVNTSESVLAQIGLEGDNPDVTNAVVTVAEINTITPAIVGADPSKESLYQDYIDANPDLFSSPATIAEVQAMIDSVNTSESVLAQIGLEGDNPDVTNAVVTVAEINTITPAIVGANPSKESLYQDYIDANPDLFSSPATIAEVQAMIDSVNTSESVLAQIGLEGDNPDVTNAVVTVAEINTITPAIVGADPSKESLYQDYIDANPDLFSSPATIAEVQAMIDGVNTSESVLAQIGLEGDNPDVTNAVVTVAEINTITPAIVGADPSKESLYQDYIDANPDLFSSPATIAEVQAMIDSVNTSESVLAQIGLEGDNPDVTNAVVTVAEINTITPAIVGADPSKESLYQDYIDANPDLFSSPATIAEVQAMIDSVNTSESVLAQIGLEGDNPDVTNAVVTVAEINTITPAIEGADLLNEEAYQNYIDENPDLFSSPATLEEVQAMIDEVNASEGVLAQIGLEADIDNIVDSEVTVEQINTLIPVIVGADLSNEEAYQDYIDANPELFSSPATLEEVQAMVNAVNTSQEVLAQIGLEGDVDDTVASEITVDQINTLSPAIEGADSSNEEAYQDYIDANPELFSSPATVEEVQAMVDAVNTSQEVLAQIGVEGDMDDTVVSEITVDQINTLSPAVEGADSSNEEEYQDYIDANPDLFSSPATVEEVQAMVDAVNTSQEVLAQIGIEGDVDDTVASEITVDQINTLSPAIEGADSSNEEAYQDYIDANPELFSSPATLEEVQAMVDTVNTSQEVLAQIGMEGDVDDTVTSEITVDQINTLSPAVEGADSSNEEAYQDYIDANPELFSSPATIEEIQAMVDIVNVSQNVLTQIGLEGDIDDTVTSEITVDQINTLSPAIEGADSSNEEEYQDYIDANPALFSSPATVEEVQAMVDAVNTSQDVLAQIGLEGDIDDTVISEITVDQINSLSPAIEGADSLNEEAYQDYIDANPELFSSPATIEEIQDMVDIVNASQDVLTQIGIESDELSIESIVTVDQINLITPSVTGVEDYNEEAYQDYIDSYPQLFSSPATVAEIQAMIDYINKKVIRETGLCGNSSIYPNPVVNELKLSYISKIRKVTIFNLLGKEVFDTNGSELRMNIDFNNFSEGVYLVRISTERLTKVCKIIKKN
ncbi:T9SS type A sorting domain-containing protein [Tenacibaculum sp. nBUS_03]|uniref:T9SS type A sorting domain-containing protein n=1 Tax=Tenacibaculum sp. nBUS_03 TaxID=3395320 RepID=UPI003EB7D0CA